MRRVSPFLLPLILAAAAAPAAAQEAAPGQAAGLRYLSWTGRTTAAAAPTAAETPVRRADLRRPNTPIPRGGFARAEPPSRLMPAPGTVPGRLTPANAWMRRPEPAPVEAALSAPPPAPAEVTIPEATDVAPVARMETPRELLPPGYPDYAPNRGGRQQPIPSDVLTPAPTEGAPVYGDGTGEAPPAPAADPMAPRRDAPIFRLNRPSTQPAPVEAAPAEPAPAQPRAQAPAPRPVALVTPNTADRPASQGARYYSVHRQNGRTPDALAMPEPTYVDALAVTLAETPASQDLARPDQGPTLIRDNQGRVRAAPAASDGDHQ